MSTYYDDFINGSSIFGPPSCPCCNPPSDPPDRYFAQINLVDLLESARESFRAKCRKELANFWETGDREADEWRRVRLHLGVELGREPSFDEVRLRCVLYERL